MLTLFIGTDYVANRNAILGRIAEDVKQKKAGRILLVQELISHDMERRLCYAAGDTVSRYAEVLSFTRLMRRFCEETGCTAPACLDAGGRIVAMASATRQLHGVLKAFSSAATRPEFLSGLVDAVDEFKRCCITPDDLKRASRATEGSLAQKLEELSLIYAGYDGICENGKQDPRDQMTWLLEQMEASDFAAGHIFYIEGFPDFTRQHLQILRHLIANTDVTVSLCCDNPGSGHMAFEKAGETGKNLIRMAQELEIPYQIVSIAPEKTPLEPVYSAAFQGDIPDPVDGLRTGKLETVFEECTAAAERIMDLVRSGARYRDISVVCADMNTYETPLAMQLRRCGIPLYRSGTESVLDQSAIFTVSAALEAAFGGFQQEDMLLYIKSAMSPVSVWDSDMLENYVIMWHISGKQWLTPWSFNPDGLGQEMTPERQERVDALNLLREQIVVPLNTLRSGFSTAGNVREQVLAVYRFLEDIQFAQRLEQTAHSMEEAGNGEQSQILNQLWDILLSALEQLYNVLGDTVWDRDTFARLLRLLLGQYKVGTIPPVLDAVMFGPCNAMHSQECDHLILLGASEGSLPRFNGSSGVLSDWERTSLRQMGVPLTGGGMEGVQAEFSDIYGVLCSARQTIHTTYSEREPSYIYCRLSEMAGNRVLSTGLIGSVLADPVEASAYLSRFGARQTAEALGLADTYDRITDRCRYEMGAISRDGIHKLYGDHVPLSATKTDRLANCKLSYFLEYGLNLQERSKVEIDARQFGSYVHSVLEETVRGTMALGGFQTVPLEDVLDIARRSSNAYIKEVFADVQSQWVLYLLKCKERELELIVEELWKELHASEFEPVGCEIGFGPGKELKGIPIQGDSLHGEMRGKVDRIDVWRHGEQSYYRVVDYKTMNKSFDYCDVYNGIDLQMLIYLFALEEMGAGLIGENPTPAGVLYFPAKAPMLSQKGVITPEQAAQERSKSWKRHGLLLDDTQVLDAMRGSSDLNRLCFSVSKDGTRKGDLADPAQLDMLKRYLLITLKKMVNVIASGDVQADPYTRGSENVACKYCHYGPICGYGDVEGRRVYQKTPADRFWSDVKEEVERGG